MYAQFLIERRCPRPWHPVAAVRRDPPDWPPALLPVCVWVELERGSPLPCGGETYRILCSLPMTNASGAMFWLDAIDSIPHVCEHMGRLIE